MFVHKRNIGCEFEFCESCTDVEIYLIQHLPYYLNSFPQILNHATLIICLISFTGYNNLVTSIHLLKYNYSLAVISLLCMKTQVFTRNMRCLLERNVAIAYQIKERTGASSEVKSSFEAEISRVLLSWV